MGRFIEFIKHPIRHVSQEKAERKLWKEFQEYVTYEIDCQIIEEIIQNGKA